MICYHFTAASVKGDEKPLSDLTWNDQRAFGCVLSNMALQEQQAKRNSWCPAKPHYYSAPVLSVSYLSLFFPFFFNPRLPSASVLTFTMHNRTLESACLPPTSSECNVKWCLFFRLFVWLAEHEYELYDALAYYFQTWRTSVILVLLKCVSKSHGGLQSWVMVNSSRTIKIKSKLFLILGSSLKNALCKSPVNAFVFYI